MNWYYNSDGNAQGPLDEEAMAARLREGDVTSDTLIWQRALSQWQSIRQLSPAWAQQPPAPTNGSKSAPVSPETPSVSRSRVGSTPARSTLTPKAPSEDSNAPAKTGFLKRLFKRG